MRSLLLLTLLLLISCGNQFAGTGQAGQARFEGVVYATSGAPAAHCTVNVAGPSYVSDEFQSRSAGSEFFTVITDKDGKFQLTFNEERTVTLSSRKLKDVFLSQNLNVSIEGGSGSFYYEEGTPFTITPWWEGDNTPELFTVPGTPWSFNVEDTGTTEIFLPKQELELIHIMDDKNMYHSVNPAEDTTLNVTHTVQKLFEMPEVVMVDEVFTINVLFPPKGYEGGDNIFIYRDGVNPEVTTRETRVQKSFTTDGEYSVTVSVYNDNNPTYEPGKAVGTLEMIQTRKIIVIPRARGGDN